jgi:uncharacterized membrane protein YkoI
LLLARTATLTAIPQSIKESRMQGIRSKLVTGAVVATAAVSAAAIATAATTGSASSSSTTAAAQGQPQRDPSQGGHTVDGKTEKLLTGDVASKVRAAALAKVSGTVERVETNVDSSAPYEAHIRESDGTEVEVQVGSDYTVSAVNEMGGAHP